MTTSKQPYLVVVGTDFSEQANRALREAVVQATRHAPAELHVVHASFAASPDALYPVAPFAGLGGMSVEALAQQEQQLHRHLDEQLRGAPNFPSNRLTVVSHVVLDAPMFALTRLASELKADLIVVGSHGRHGLTRWLLGSVAEGVVRQADCPVLVVPPPAELPEIAIEPPCAQCVIARSSSGGRELWCEQHRERHGRRHVYHQGDRMAQSSNFPLISR